MGGTRQAGDLDLDIVALGEGGGLVALGVLGDHMIGRRGRVGEHHRRLALGEEAIGFRPAGGDGQHAVLELGPGFRGLVAIDGLHPEQQAEAGRRGARVLDDDLLRRVALDQFLEARWRGLQRLRVVDDGEVAVVVGQERIVGEAARNGEAFRLQAVRLEEAGRLGFRDQVRVEAEHHVGLRALALQLEAGQQFHAVGDADPFDLAAAGLLELRLDLRPRSPFGDEALIGVDGQRLFLREGGKGQRYGERRDGRKKCRAHQRLLVWSQTGIGRWIEPSNPSAGTSRIRFFGLANASQPAGRNLRGTPLERKKA